MSETGTLETREDGEKEGESQSASYWLMQLELSEKDHKDFLKDGDAVCERYKADKFMAATGKSSRFNILYSNTETLKAAVYARQAKPDVRRRFSDQDPVGRIAADVLERSLIFSNDAYEGEDVDDVTESAVEDYLLPGRGIVRVDYEPEIEEGLAPDGQTKIEVLADQEVCEKYVYWKDFRHGSARKWAKVPWISYRHLMSREDLRENFEKAIADAVTLNWSPDTGDSPSKLSDAFKRAEVWEIWDKDRKERVWVSKGYKDILRTDKDPYRLQNFFNCAKPLLAITTNSTLIPQAEFAVYKVQADALNEIEERIDKLTRALKRRGIYDETFKELEKLSRAADNQFIPVKNFSDLTSKGGLAAAFQTEDIVVLSNVLKELYVQRQARIQAIYEITGISDILRGASDPGETLGAQRLKAQFGGARLKKRQDKVQKWIRDTQRIKAELIAEHFEPKKLQEITGIDLTTDDPQNPQAMEQKNAVMELLRSDKMRSYRVDIETDSTVFEDAEQEKKSRIELITAMTGFMAQAVPLGEKAPELMPFLFEVLAFGTRGFKAGRSLEESLDQVKQAVTAKLQQQQQAPPQQAQPDPKVVVANVKAGAEVEKAKLGVQGENLKLRGKVVDHAAKVAGHNMNMTERAADVAPVMQPDPMQAQMQPGIPPGVVQ